MNRLLLVVLCSIVISSCEKDLKSNTRLDIDQVQYMEGQNTLCFNDYIDFDNYTIYGPEDQDSIKWMRSLETPGEWERFASGNPIEIPVADWGVFSYTAFQNGDSTVGQFEIVHCFRHVYLSSAFSPTYDGLNDSWKPTISDNTQSITSYYLRIMTIEGVTLFETGDQTIGWDGQHNEELMPPGTYMYYIRVEFDDDTYSEYSGDIAFSV